MCGQSWTALGTVWTETACLGNLMCHLCLHGRKCWQHKHRKKQHKTNSGTDSSVMAKMSIYLLIYSNFVFGFISIFDCISSGLCLVMKLKLIMICTSSALASKQETGREAKRVAERGEGNPISWLNKSTWEPSSLPAEIVFIVAEIVA